MVKRRDAQPQKNQKLPWLGGVFLLHGRTDRGSASFFTLVVSRCAGALVNRIRLRWKFSYVQTYGLTRSWRWRDFSPYCRMPTFCMVVWTWKTKPFQHDESHHTRLEEGFLYLPSNEVTRHAIGFPYSQVPYPRTHTPLPGPFYHQQSSSRWAGLSNGEMRRTAKNGMRSWRELQTHTDTESKGKEEHRTRLEHLSNFFSMLTASSTRISGSLPNIWSWNFFSFFASKTLPFVMNTSLFQLPEKRGVRKK